MKMWHYNSYQEYVAAQTEANKRKLQNIWVRPETVAKISCFYAPSGTEKILCHGTRNGAEQKLFKQHFPKAFVVGTEISDNADAFQHTVQHDFHEPMPSWVGKFDVVYTNALDHAYSPLTALRAWRDQLKPTGRLFVEYSFTPENNTSKASDPLELNQDELVALFEDAGLKTADVFAASGVKGTPDCESVVFVLERA